MKMTVITEKGNVVGAVYGHIPQPSADEFVSVNESAFRAGLMAGPGQELHVIDASEKILAINSPTELVSMLTAELKKKRI
jgi:hypothetical protein